MFIAAALALRRSLWLPSTMFWSLVYACTVLRYPLSMPNFSSITLSTGARQFVVHEARENTVMSFETEWSLTPGTIVASTSFPGAEMSTILAPAFMCFSASARERNAPVLSSTRSTPSSFHGSFSGSVSSIHLIS